MNNFDNVNAMDNVNSMVDVNAMVDDSDLRITMERYSYNLWALLALICVLFIFKIIDQSYLYNVMILFIFTIFFTIYFAYSKKK
jgi:hypothetical protein